MYPIAKKIKILMMFLLFFTLNCIASNISYFEKVYLLKVNQTDSIYPEHSLTEYFLLNEGFWNEFDKKKVKKNEYLFDKIIKLGAKKIIFPIYDFEVLSCCEAENIFEGYEKYKLDKYDNLIKERYEKNAIRVNFLIENMKENLTLSFKTSLYRLSIYELNYEFCECRKLLGRDTSKFIYINSITYFEEASFQNLERFKNILSPRSR